MGKTIAQVKMWNIFDEEKIERGEMFPNPESLDMPLRENFFTTLEAIKLC